MPRQGSAPWLWAPGILQGQHVMFYLLESMSCPPQPAKFFIERERGGLLQPYYVSQLPTQ